MNLIRAVLRLYPQRWRERYAGEMAALLEEHPPSWRDLGDLALHALDARMNPAMLFAGVPAHKRRLVLMQKLRSLEMTIFAAFIAMLIAYFQFSGMFDAGPYSRPNAGPLFAQNWSDPLSLVYNLAEIGMLVAFGAILVCGIPLIASIWRRSAQLRGLLMVPVYAFIAVLLPPLIILAVAGPRVNVYLSFVNLITFAYTIWFIALAWLSTASVTRAVVRSQISDRLTQFAMIPSAIIIMAMVTILAASVAWGPIAHEQSPHVFAATDWDTGYPTWALDVAVMTAAVVVALVAAMQGIALSRKFTHAVEPVA